MWPIFVSQPVIPVLLGIFRWLPVLIWLAVISLLWQILVVPRAVEPRLAYWGVVWGKLKFLTCPLMSWLLWSAGRHAVAILALLWPLACLLAMAPVTVFAEAILSATPVGQQAQIGVVQERFMVALGYEKTAEIQTADRNQ
jgi:hypothetical protein